MDVGEQEAAAPGEPEVAESPTRERALDLLRTASSIFIAYSHADLRHAQAFWRTVVRLRRGRPADSVFLDQESLKPGSAVSADDIARRLDASDLFVVLCGADTADRVHVNREIDEALRQRESRGLAVLPVILTAGVPLPPGLDFRVQGIFLTTLFPDVARRRRIRRAVVGTLLALAVAGAGVALHYYRQREARTREARAQRLTAQAREMQDADPQRAVLLAVEAVRATAADRSVLPPARQELREAVNNSYGYGLGSHRGPVRALAFTPDGHRLATASDDGTTRLWNVEAHDPAERPIVLRGHTAPVTSLALDAKGTVLVTGSDDGTVRAWTLTASDPAASSTVLESPGPSNARAITSVALTPDGRRVVGARGTTVWVWQLDGSTPGRPIAELGHSQQVDSLAMSPDGRWLATENCDGSLWSIDAADVPRTRRRLAMPTGCVKALAFSPDSRWLVTGSQDNVARLWNLTRKDPTAAPVLVKGYVAGLQSFSGIDLVAVPPGDHWFLTGYGDGSVQMWDWRDKTHVEPEALLKGHARRVRSVVADSKGRWLATLGEDGNVYLWDPSAQDPERTRQQLASHVGIAAFAIGPNRWMASGAMDGTVRVARLPPDPDDGGAYARRGAATAVSPDSRWVATSRSDGAVFLWDLSTDHPNQEPILLPGHTKPVNDLAISPDGRWLATSSYDRVSLLWDLRAPDIVASAIPLRSRGEPAQSLLFSGDGRRIIVAGNDGSVVARDLSAPATASPRVIRHAARGEVLTVASRDGRWLATGYSTAPIRIWSLEDERRPPMSLGTEGALLWPLTISDDGRWLVGGSDGCRAHLWDLKAADPSRSEIQLQACSGDSFALDVSDDGRRVAAGGDDGTVHLWDLSATDPAAAPRTLGRHEGKITRVVLEHRGQRLLTADATGLVRLWDLAAADPGGSAIDLRGHETGITALAESTDLHWLVTGDAGGVVRVWDLQAKDIAASVGTLPTHGGQVVGVMISPDAQWVVTLGTDTSVHLSTLSLERMMHQARGAAGRNLRPDEWAQYFPGEAYRPTFPDIETPGAEDGGPPVPPP